MNWKLLEKEKPHCYELGHWDGKSSDFLLFCDSDGHYFTGKAYEGFMDGSYFLQFYDERDFEIDHVVYWLEIQSP